MPPTRSFGLFTPQRSSTLLAMMDDYANYDGLGLAQLVRNKQVTPAELLDAAIDQAEAIDPQINAVIDKFYDEAHATLETLPAEAPFRGVPFLVKDILAAYRGRPMRSGSRLFADYVPDHDGEIVRRYKAAGVVTFGKTNAPEFGLMPVTEPELFGATLNPWDPKHTPGGSSGGSAAAVAARIVPIAHGNDGGGSIRVPASCCGLFGLKPSRGRNPIGPDCSEAWQGFACDHVLTRSVRDSAAMLDATCGPEPGGLHQLPNPERPFLDEVGAAPGKLRIALMATPLLGRSVHPDCVDGVEKAAQLCRELGHEVSEDAPAIDGEDFAKAFMTMVCAETGAAIRMAPALIGRQAKRSDVELATWILSMLGRHTSSVALVRAQQRIHAAVRQIGRFFENYDVLLTPTLSQPPLRIGELGLHGAQAVTAKLLAILNYPPLAALFSGIDAIAEDAFAFVSFTPPFNATGQPAMSVPLHWNADGLPIGIHFVGRHADEATLFRLAGQLEAAQPWEHRRPGIVAS